MDKVEALERRWQGEPGVLDTAQLSGDWELRVPEDSGARGWFLGDVTHRIISLYSGRMAKVLQMKLISTPTLKVWRTGAAETGVELQWGFTRDRLLTASRIEVTSANRLRASQVSVKSSKLKMAVDLPKQERNLRVTYFDGQLLIVRDASGTVDILWRRDGPAFRPAALTSKARAPAASAGQVPAEQVVDGDTPDDGETGTTADAAAEKPPHFKVMTSLRDIQAVRDALEAKRAQMLEDRVSRRRLEGDMHRAAASLNYATSQSAADEVAVKIFETIENRTSQSASSQRARSEEELQAFSEQEENMAAKEEDVAKLRADLDMLKIREDAVQLHMRELTAEIRAVPRARRQAFRNAISKAKSELQEVRSTDRETTKRLRAAEAELARVRRDVNRGRTRLDDEIATRQHIERQLEGQRQQFTELKVKHIKAVEHEQELSEEVAMLQAELKALEVKEAEARELAESMEEEVAQVMAEANKVRSIARGIRSTWRSRIWPIR